MRATAILVVLSILLTACGNEPKEQEAKNTTEVATETKPKNVADLVPDGYTLYETYPGNLNMDEHEDMVVVLNAIDTAEEMLNRGVMLVTTDAKGQLTVAAFNPEGAYCPDCGGAFGEPLEGVTIEAGQFTIEHFGGAGWRWTDNPTFKYNDAEGKWYLQEHKKTSMHSGDPENTYEEEIRTTADFGAVDFEAFRY